MTHLFLSVSLPKSRHYLEAGFSCFEFTEGVVIPEAWLEISDHDSVEWAVDDRDEGTIDHDRVTLEHDGEEGMSAITHDTVGDDVIDVEDEGMAAMFMRFARNSAATESLAFCFFASSSLCSGSIRSAKQDLVCRYT